jgi:hypothetical protein
MIFGEIRECSVALKSNLPCWRAALLVQCRHGADPADNGPLCA